MANRLNDIIVRIICPRLSWPAEFVIEEYSCVVIPIPIFLLISSMLNESISHKVSTDKFNLEE
ncbi:hypothetical protein [Clostridioides difficile]|uniref:hypothetical protein n=1 Tax=Clostridioides difficile TaxID=1496 RepID=UPI00093FCDFD|nr:hypothetical protein [Clostridioides difficile]